MRTIKFRGRYWNRDGLDAAESQYREGEMIYGGYALLKNSVGNGDYIVDIHGICYLVYPDSVAQLVGYDSNGAEIYEGDTLIDAFDNQYEVQVYPMGVNDDDCINLADSAKLNLTLKEDQS